VYNRFGRRFADPELKEELLGLQRQQLKEVLGNFIEMSMTPQEDPKFRAMFELDDAIALWQELDVYKQGYVPADQVAKLIEAAGYYSIPPAESQYVGLIFNSFTGRIE